MRRLGLALVLLVGVFLSVVAGNQTEGVVVRDLSDEWLVFDEDEEAYVPVIGQDYEQSKALFLNLENYKSYMLRFEGHVGLCLFVGEALVYKVQENGLVEVPVQDLLGVKPHGRSLLRFFNEKGKLPTRVVISGGSSGLLSQQSEIYQGVVRDKDVLGNVFILGIFVFVALATFIKRSSPAYFESFFGFSKLFGGRAVEDYILSNLMGFWGFLVMFVVALLTALVIVTSGFTLFDPNLIGLESVVTERQVFSLFAWHVGLVFVLLLLKYLFLQVLSFVFGSKLASFHFFEFVRMELLATLLLMVLVLVVGMGSGGGVVLKAGLLIVVSFWMFRLAIVANRQMGFQKIYLISYLCMSELVPGLLLLEQMHGWV